MNNRNNPIRRFRCALIFMVILATGCQPPEKQNVNEPLPDWATRLVTTRKVRLIEESTLQGRRVFHVMPSDRADDVGNEHVLYAQDGQIICEFGGIAGQVAVGTCDVAEIKFVRTIFKQG